MDSTLKKRYFRLIYSKAFGYFGTALVLCALVGGLYGDRIRFIFALCAGCGVFSAWSWFSYLVLTGLRLPGLEATGARKKKIPFSLRKKKEGHRPSFIAGNEAFDDDLNDATLVSEDVFSEKQRKMARVWSRALCAALLLLASLIIPR